MLAPAFFILKKVKKFRVPAEVEIKGLDIFKHGEAAYPLTAYGHGWDEVEHIKDPTVRQEALRKISEHVDGNTLRVENIFFSPIFFFFSPIFCGITNPMHRG